ncbi:ORF6N domain-containing protein [bacterium]|nr:ORF6N domain-containing protein [bacterium]
MTRKVDTAVVPQARIERVILVVRGVKVILDAELAALYGVPTKRLNEQVKRNADRFPEDFRFRLTREEHDAVLRLSLEAEPANRSQIATAPNRSQFVTDSQKHRDPRYLPWAFTEHETIMAANVLNSRRAVEMSVHVVRTFVRLREAAGRYEELARRLRQVEQRVGQHDTHLAGILRALRQLAEAPEPKRIGKTGFAVPEKRSK